MRGAQVNDKPLLPLILVSGFLGAGKTTFVRHLLRDAANRSIRVGVVINEFGIANVDGAILRATGARMVGNLAGGCACCSSAEEMIWTLVEVGQLPREEQPDAVVLEASGMADPLVMLDCLTVAALLPLVRVASVVSLFDAHRLSDLRSQRDDLAPLLKRQAALADWLLVSKSDRAFPWGANAPRARAEAVLREINNSAHLGFAKGGAINLDGLWAQVQSARRDKPGDVGKAIHGAAQSWVLPMRKPIERARLEEAFRQLSPLVWRAKGFVHIENEGLFLVQYTGSGDGHLDIEPFDTKRGFGSPPTELVFIGPQLPRAAIARDFLPNAFLALT